MENTQHVKGYKLAVFIINFLRSHPHLTADSHFNKEKRTCRLPEVMRFVGAQWLSGRVLDSRPKGRGFEPHRRHCVVVLEQDTFILA